MAMPNLKKAELIEGMVYVGSPVRINVHSEPDQDVQTWLGLYRHATPGIRGGGNGTMRLSPTSVTQPDGFLMIPPEAGGRSQIDDDDYLARAPELVVEVAASSASYDLHEKFLAYQRAGAIEYVVFRVRDSVIDWFALRDGRFEQMKATDGILKSVALPGLWIHEKALQENWQKYALDVLADGLRSAEHEMFVDTLRVALTNALEAKEA
jgi:Uma2 family endonuclease